MPNDTNTLPSAANVNRNVASQTAQSGGKYDDHVINWGAQASRTDMSVFGKLDSVGDGSTRNFLRSRLWHGVPQLTADQMAMFEAAYTGHTFIFFIDGPKFMNSGYYEGKKMHYLMKNFKAVVERASTGFSGVSPIIAQMAEQEDGNGRKLSHVINVTKEQSNISLTLHEFAGLPVKNFIEAWLTGIYDIRSQHGNYHGNLGIPGGWCLRNHSMSILVVQVTPDWTTIQDAAYYYNMVPTEVPFSSFEWRKGEATIIDDYDIDFVCNEERSPAIMYAAEKFMNNRILSMVGTSVYNSRQFVIDDFKSTAPWQYVDDQAAKGDHPETIYDKTQYNQYIANNNFSSDTDTLIGKYEKDEETKDHTLNSKEYTNNTK